METELKNRISILSDCASISNLEIICEHRCNEKYEFLIDYINWAKNPDLIPLYTTSFLELLIKKDEKNLMEYLMYSKCDLSIIEKYMNSKYMDIILLINYQCVKFTPEFVDKYIKDMHNEYYLESLFYTKQLNESIKNMLD